MHSDFNKGGLSDLAMADLLLGAYCCLGWGQLTGRMPENTCKYGSVPVAKFLYTALKLYFRECEEILEKSVVL
ncbi:putative signal peptide protein [Puccinia sorghi]|uniref:Putative signal peptide protein n=1 Tax=Puccinia sorghi TaxID=27349 RepID=A0A0L6VER2_9BASI|nr:putative signal peptide protein [Puccinia sorghi]